MKDYLRKRTTPVRLLIIGGMLALVSCGDDPVSQEGDGTILVTALTLGTDFDPNGYSVSVNSGQPLNLGLQDTIWVENLEAGNYQVGLAGIAENCTSTGQNPITVAVVPIDTVNAEFEVTCDVPPPEDPDGGNPVP